MGFKSAPPTIKKMQKFLVLLTFWTICQKGPLFMNLSIRQNPNIPSFQRVMNISQSLTFNSSGPPAWMLDMQEMELDLDPKLLKGNMEVGPKASCKCL